MTEQRPTTSAPVNGRLIALAAKFTELQRCADVRRRRELCHEIDLIAREIGQDAVERVNVLVSYNRALAGTLL
jgi:hypothetical protein